MTEGFIKQAKEGKPVYITDVRKAYDNLQQKQKLSCVLNMLGEKQRLFEINMPSLDGLDKEGKDFVKSYAWAEIYNVLTSLGGKSMTVYVDRANNSLLKFAEGLNDVFDIDKSRADRKGYGRVINVIDRMLGAIYPQQAGKKQVKFRFTVKDKSEMPTLPAKSGDSSGDTGIFKKVAETLAGKVICGMDIGGTDIKVAMAVDGRLCCLKEYDWSPQGFALARQLIDPICILVRLARAKISLDADKSLSADVKAELGKQLEKAMHKEAACDFMEEVTDKVENALKGKIVEIDTIGLCFPDVVVKNKVVGGESPKTKGMRENPNIDYEEEFAKITNLDEQLLKLCKKGGVVRNTNDGPMAAFTAAVEMSASGSAEQVKDGIFAHTLGTDLGSGWVDEAGLIPDMPLECYNIIIDLGSFPEKKYTSSDARSLNNTNTALAGTLQRYTNQTGVFRLAIKSFPEKRPDLYKELFDKGFLAEKEMDGRKMLVVPTEPKDMRKGFLEHMMSLPEREKDELTSEIFRQIGVFLAVTWSETQRILQPKAKSRILFGRVVKNSYCFKLMQAGAKSRQSDLQLDVADAGMANTELMKQLEADEYFTVAQFAQAIGAIYYGNQGLLT